MKNCNKYDEVFPNKERIIERIKSISDGLKSNFEHASDNNRFIAVSEFIGKDNPKSILRAFAQSLNIEHVLPQKDFSGVYVFAKKDKKGKFVYLYTGISRNVIERVNSHVNRTDSGTATWAFQMAKYNYDKNKNAKIPENEIKLKISEIQRTEIANFYVSFIHEPDNFIMHIAEGFVACAFECEWNSFKTH